MGISPITGLTPLPIVRHVEADFGIPPMERIENNVSTGDETYSPSEGRSADESDEEFKDEFEDQLEEEEPDAEEPAPVKDPNSQVNFFV